MCNVTLTRKFLVPLKLLHWFKSCLTHLSLSAEAISSLAPPVIFGVRIDGFPTNEGAYDLWVSFIFMSEAYSKLKLTLETSSEKIIMMSSSLVSPQNLFRAEWGFRQIFYPFINLMLKKIKEGWADIDKLASTTTWLVLFSPDWAKKRMGLAINED